MVADEEEREALVIVPDYQLSLAIGKEGQNARLAARLTGYKIDIKSETQAKEQGLFEELGIEYQEDMVDYHYQEDEDFQEEEYDSEGEGFQEETYSQEDLNVQEEAFDHEQEIQEEEDSQEIAKEESYQEETETFQE